MNHKLKAPSYKLQTGFTLIEILVVFSVVAILAGIGIAAFVTYSRAQQVNQTANNLKLLINQARFNALSVVKTNTDINGNSFSCGAEVLNGYTVGIVGGNSIELTQDCNNTQPQRIKMITLPTGLSFDITSTCTQIQFGSLSSRASGVPCNLVVTGYGQTKTITVDAIGNSSVQ